jgi:hypothetical protein
MQTPQAFLVHTFPKHTLGGPNTSFVFDIKEARLQTSNLVVFNTKSVHPEYGITLNETVTVFEFTSPRTSNEATTTGWFDFSNFKMPAYVYFSHSF